MRVWRISSRRWAQTTPDGEGARRSGGRWNHKGTAVVYTSSSLSLAALELFVHLAPEDIPEDLASVSIDIPDNIATDRISVSDLPLNWREYPAPAALKDIGTDWIRSQTALALLVPSVLVPGETNVLINPSHNAFPHCQISASEPFHFDSRMWKQ